jgi:hypothetical protein
MMFQSTVQLLERTQHSPDTFAQRKFLKVPTVGAVSSASLSLGGIAVICISFSAVTLNLPTLLQLLI